MAVEGSETSFGVTGSDSRSRQLDRLAREIRKYAKMVVRDHPGSCLSGFIWTYIAHGHDIAQGNNGKSSFHTHAVLGLRSLRSGYFLSGSALLTLEVTITVVVEHLRHKRRMNPEIAMIRINLGDRING